MRIYIKLNFVHQIILIEYLHLFLYIYIFLMNQLTFDQLKFFKCVS